MIYSICSSTLSVQINSLGSELWSIRDNDDTEYLWQGDEKYWKGRAPVLFPFVGRLPGGHYEMDGQSFSFPIHGFASKTEFDCVAKDEDRIILEMHDTPETRLIYPRKFRFGTEYRISDERLDITYSVYNTDDRTMYFGLGGHPAFNVPPCPGSSFEDWYLEFDTQCSPFRVGFAPTLLINGEESAFALSGGKYLTLSHGLFDDDAVILGNVSSGVSLKNTLNSTSIRISCPGMRYIGFWHMPHTDAPYICIEPWCSLPARNGEPAVFERKNDLISLGAGESYNNTWSVEIRPDCVSSAATVRKTADI